MEKVTLKELQKRAKLLTLRLERKVLMTKLEEVEEKAYDDIRNGVEIKPGGIHGYLHGKINALTRDIEKIDEELDYSIVAPNANMEEMLKCLG